MAEKKSEPVDVDLTKATPIEPGKPVEGGVAPTQMGATFAERSGKKAPPASKVANSTFADRAKSVKSDDAEDKSVSSASTKSRAKKKS